MGYGAGETLGRVSGSIRNHREIPQARPYRAGGPGSGQERRQVRSLLGSSEVAIARLERDRTGVG